MFSKYDGCIKHWQTETSNFDPHCADCWAALAKQKQEETETSASFGGMPVSNKDVKSLIKFHNK